MRNTDTGRIFIVAVIISVIVGACAEFYEIAQGTGTWWKGFAFSWAIFFAIFCIVCLSLIVGLIYLAFNKKALSAITNKWFGFRERLGIFRWLLILVIGLLPVLLLQISVWGIVFQGFFIRSSLWILVIFFLTILVSDREQVIEWKYLLAIIVFTAGMFAMVASLQNVANYPFSLGWSEGNRLWDYSIMFGRNRYIFPSNENIYFLLDIGRQFVGGIPFLFSGNTILTQRLWVGLTDIFPYIIFGMALFSFERGNVGQYLTLILWTYLFLNQGPIHPPLILSAALIAVAWRKPLWSALLLTAVAAGVATISRYTWMFAPASWILILELSKLSDKSNPKSWVRLALLTLTAAVTGVLLPGILALLQNKAFTIQDAIANSNVIPDNIQTKISRQALLWDRVLPNSTYSPGILLGLILTVLPLLLLIYHLYRTQTWRISHLQKFVFIAIAAAFLSIGIIVSVKIGGGGDLHNLDMFLITLAFIAGIVWMQGGKEWLINSSTEPLAIRSLLIMLLIIPGLAPLQQMRSHGFYKLAPWLVTLTGVNNEKALGLIPSHDIAASSLEAIRSNIQSAQHTGEILFIDQRQLLTFGYIKGVSLVPEYDKKVLIERAFTQNKDYFNKFYSDLENKRFSLIIIQPLTIGLQGSQDQFGEENNTWVKWVTKPLLCFYDVKLTLWEVNVQLLTPRSGSVNCSSKLP